MIRRDPTLLLLPAVLLLPTLLLVFVYVLLATVPAGAVSSPAELLPDHAQELRAEAIGGQLRCLVCQNQSLEDSDADLARDLRKIVRQRITAGDSDQQVINWMVDRYGDFVRLRPPFRPLTWILWFSPVICLAVGALAVLLTRRRTTTPLAPLEATERARLDRLLQEP
jgi:cytochrome c-type biogenesis protein CcmH